MIQIIAAASAALLVTACADGAPDGADKGRNAAKGAEASLRVAEQAQVDPAAPLVVAFGDSLYAGYGLDAGEGFAPELQRQLAASGTSVTVFNAGVSGDTSSAGQLRLAFTLDGLPKKPDLVIVGLGGNDLLRGIEPAMTRQNLTAILTELERRDIPVMLTGMRAPPNMGADYVRDFESIYSDLAARFDAPLYPFFFNGIYGNSSLFLPDGIHPTAAGIDIVVERVAPLVADALPETGN
jgi:acyl-CoA thioesterase I